MSETIHSRVKIKRSTEADAEPVIGPSSDHTDGTWDENDIYPGEFYFNQEDEKLWIGGGADPIQIPIVSATAPTLKYFEFTFTSGAILDGNTTPREMVEAIAGKTFRLHTYNVEAVDNGGGIGGLTAYAANVNLQIYTNGADAIQAENDQILQSTTPKILIGHLADPTVTGDDVQLIENAALMVRVQTGNPTTGDFDVKITGFYYEI